MSASRGGSIWRVAGAIAWRSLHTYVRVPALFVPSLVFPLVFLAGFAGGLSALGSVFTFPAGYTAFQFVFILCQSSMFAGLFTGFTLAFDFESGFARRLMLAAEDRRGIALGYALVGLSRAAITLTLVTGVALATGMRITGNGIDVFGLYCLAALLVLVGYGWAAGVAFRFRSIQAGPLMQTPVFLLLFLAPDPPAQRLDPRRRDDQPRDRVPAGRPWADLRRARPHRPRLRRGRRSDPAVRRLDGDRPAPRRARGLSARAS
jgi:ABC-2 type transport system permease protein